MTLSSVVISNSADAAEWRIIPSLTVEETYTDNLRLAPRGQEQSDWITEISPGVSVTGRGARLQFSAAYALQYRYYLKNSDENGFGHSLISNALWEAYDKQLFVEASASVSQQNISPLGPQAQSNANVTGNRTEVRSTSISPYWIRNLGSWATANVRYTWSKTESSGDFSVYDSESNLFSAALSSGPRFTDFGWGIAYNLSKYDSSEGAFGSRESESTVGNVRYRIFPTLALTGSLGYERNDYADRESLGTSGTTWTVGADWAPNSRTRVSGAYGERYFGNTKRLDITHRTRLTTWSLGYSEDVTQQPFIGAVPIIADTASTLDRLFLATIPDARERQLAVQRFIAQNALSSALGIPVQFLTNQVTLSKRLQAGFGLLGTRTSLLMSVFRDERTNLSVSEFNGPFDPFAISDTVEQTGFSTALTWRISGQTTASASFGGSRNRYPDAAREDKDAYIRLALTHQLQPKVLGSVQVRMVDRSSDDVNNEYRERAIIGTLRMTF